MELKIRKPGFSFCFYSLGILLTFLSLSLLFCKVRQLNWMSIDSPSIPKISLLYVANI